MTIIISSIFGRPFYCPTWGLLRPLTEMSAIQNNIPGPQWSQNFPRMSQQDIVVADCFAKIQIRIWDFRVSCGDSFNSKLSAGRPKIINLFNFIDQLWPAQTFAVAFAPKKVSHLTPAGHILPDI